MRSSTSSAPVRGIFGLPKSCWYGLSAGLFSGFLWTVIALLPSSTSHTSSPVLNIAVFAVDLVPVALVAVSGIWLGRRNGSVRDGLIAGTVAGAALAVAYLVAVEVILLHTAIGETRAWQTNAVLVLLEYAKDDLLDALFYALIGAIVGSLSSLMGRRWGRRDRPASQESVGLAVSRIDSGELDDAELDAEVLEIVTAEALGGQPLGLAE